ncbi:MAG: peptidylprolyl isomerase [Candidatus Saganbacteria bacterium]|nr:peptidylprolyl isomerase [Candidatus Saganbacteria bacterium]
MKKIIIAVAVLFLASLLYGIGASRFSGAGRSRGKDNRIARVNGREIDSYRYGEMMNRMIRQIGQNIAPSDMAFVQNLALGQAVDFMLILEEAKRNVKISGREVDASIDAMIKREKIGSRQDLEQALKRMGLNWKQFEQMIREEILVQKMINSIRGSVIVTPDDLREIKARHILVSTEARAKTLRSKLGKGEQFAALAREYSLDPGSAKKGGDLGYFPTGKMVEPFEKIAFSLKINEVSQPVKTPFGYHIIQVLDSRLRQFGDDVKDIDQAALQEKQDVAFRKWFGGVKGKAKIEILNPVLKAHDQRFKGQIGKAITEYKEAIKADPANPYLHVYLGDTYNTIGQSDLALSEYEEAIAVEGGNPLLYLILARAYELAGRKEDAVKQYKRASLVAADDKAMHEQLLKKFKELSAWSEYEREKREIERIEKKEKFEQELQGGGK